MHDFLKKFEDWLDEDRVEIYLLKVFFIWLASVTIMLSALCGYYAGLEIADFIRSVFLIA